MAVNPVTHRLYLGNVSCGGGVRVVDGDPLSPTFRADVTQITSGSGFNTSSNAYVRGIGIDTASNVIYVGDNNNPILAAINGVTDTVLWTVPITSQAVGVAFSAATKMTYTIGGNNDISWIDADPSSGTYATKIFTLDIGSAPFLVGLDEVSGLFIVTNPADARATIVKDTRTP
jgi:hypothetical protein